MESILQHHGILGQRWGIRRYQNPDGSLTAKGQARRDKIDNKWASTKGEKIKTKVRASVQKDMVAFAKTEFNAVLKTNGKLSSASILAYNNKLAELMNSKVGSVEAPSGRLLKFVAKRGELGVHTALADAGYDLSQLQRGVFTTGKVAYKNENLMKEG